MAQKNEPGKTRKARSDDADGADGAGTGTDAGVDAGSEGRDHDAGVPIATTEADAAGGADRADGIEDAEVVGETSPDGTRVDDPLAADDDPVTAEEVEASRVSHADGDGDVDGPRDGTRLADAVGATAVTPGATVGAASDAEPTRDTAGEGVGANDGARVGAGSAGAAALGVIPAVGRTTLDRREDEPEVDPVGMTRGRLDDDSDDDHAAAPSASPAAGRSDPAVERVVERRGPGFVPLVLGGLLAGAIGWAAATYLPGGEQAPEVVEDPRVAVLEADVAALRDAAPADAAAPVNLEPVQLALDDLSTRLAVLEEGAGGSDVAAEEGLTALRGELSALRAELAPLGEEVTSVADGLGTLAERVAAVDGLPGAVETLRADVDALRGAVEALPGTVETLRGDLEGLPGQVEALRADVEPRMAEIEERMAALTETARDAEAEAEALAREAARNQLLVAVQAGDVPYVEQLETLGGDVPAALADHAENGVPTLTTLQADFPPLARDVLRVARLSGEGEAGLRALLTTATNARSLSPREGDDADAVLSRAEAALREGDLETALRELQTLPTDAQAELGAWLARARVRLEAQRALDPYLSTTG